MSSRAWLLLLELALAVNAPRAAPAATAPARTSATIARANDRTRMLLKTSMAERHIPALQVAVIVHGRVVMSEAYGVVDVEQHVAATRQTLFPVNSATKSFTGLAIMQLV